MSEPIGDKPVPQTEWIDGDNIRFLRGAEMVEQPEAKLRRWLMGNEHAVQAILEIHRIVETWDDLVDDDNPVGMKRLNAMMIGALVRLPRNPFYAANFVALNTLFEAAILDWFTANDLEELGGEDLRTSYILRCSFFSLTIAAARIIGGFDHAHKVGVEIYQAGDDPWDHYASEHGGV